ncbi:MAG: hypothetical protein PVG22_12475 [Chromatiales bacterium]|jgi:hypothetical protein
MAVKKTVKKRRATKKTRINSIEKIIDGLNESAIFSSVNKRAVDRLKMSITAVAKQEKLLATSKERVEKARNAVANAKTPATKEKAKARLGIAQSNFKELKIKHATEITEQKKAERLLRDLDKALTAAQTKLQREYDKKAKMLEKAVDRPLRRRRTSKKKVVQASE